MFYKASDASTSTRDWFSLSFNAIPWALLAHGAEEGVLSENVGDEPVEPDEDDFGTASEYEAAVKEYEDAHEAWEEASDNAGSEPMWSTLWHGDDVDRCEDEIRACGLRVMHHEDVGALIAADSAGHSFFGAYWIPLRARIAARQIERNSAEDNAALAVQLAHELRGEGEGSGDPVGAICTLLEIGPPTIEAARELYRKETTR